MADLAVAPAPSPEPAPVAPAPSATPAPAPAPSATPAPAPSPAPSPAPAPKTIAGDPAPAPAPAPVAPADFPADWRQKLAGEDKGKLKTLERFASPQALLDSYEAMRVKVSSGELKSITPKPAEGAKPEEVAAWRKENGLPETSESYVKELKLADGLVLSDADKPLVESFAQVAHALDVPQDKFNRLVDWYYATQDAQIAARQEYDATFHDESLAELAKEWGGELKPNQRVMANLMELAPGGLSPEGVGTLILTARSPDGRMLGDIPGVCRFLTQIGRELNPEATVVPAGTPNAAQAIDTEIESIRATYRAALNGDREAHWKYYGRDGKPGLDARERELIDAQAKMKQRAA